MNSKLLSKVDTVKITSDLQELNKLILQEDWLLLGATTNPTREIIYHLGHINFNRQV